MYVCVRMSALDGIQSGKMQRHTEFEEQATSPGCISEVQVPRSDAHEKEKEVAEKRGEREEEEGMMFVWEWKCQRPHRNIGRNTNKHRHIFGPQCRLNDQSSYL
jgi:hypothetical protein